VTANTFLTRVLHDSLPSDIRTGVASGVSTLSWLTFLPIALAFGWTTEALGVHTAGLLFVAVTGASGLLLCRVARQSSVGSTTWEVDELSAASEVSVHAEPVFV